MIVTYCFQENGTKSVILRFDKSSRLDRCCLCCTASALACSEMSPAGRLVQGRDGRSSSKREVDDECGKKDSWRLLECKAAGLCLSQWKSRNWKQLLNLFSAQAVVFLEPQWLNISVCVIFCGGNSYWLLLTSWQEQRDEWKVASARTSHKWPSPGSLFRPRLGPCFACREYFVLVRDLWSVSVASVVALHSMSGRNGVFLWEIVLWCDACLLFFITISRLEHSAIVIAAWKRCEIHPAIAGILALFVASV